MRLRQPRIQGLLHRHLSIKLLFQIQLAQFIPTALHAVARIPRHSFATAAATAAATALDASHWSAIHALDGTSAHSI